MKGDRAITAYEEAEAMVKQTQAASDTARQFLIDCTITAPYDGIVTARYLEEGEYVKKGTGGLTQGEEVTIEQ